MISVRVERLVRQARTPQDRCAAAKELIYEGGVNSRSFDNCFEMDDGDAVVALLRVQIAISTSLADAVIRTEWFQPRVLVEIAEQVVAAGRPLSREAVAALQAVADAAVNTSRDAAIGQLAFA